MESKGIGSQSPQELVAELESHYQSLEKLYSVVMSESFVLEKDEISILPQLIRTKESLLEEIEHKRGNLTKWYADWENSDILLEQSLEFLVDPISKLRTLVRKILTIEKNNAQHLKEKAFFNQEERRAECM